MEAERRLLGGLAGGGFDAALFGELGHEHDPGLALVLKELDDGVELGDVLFHAGLDELSVEEGVEGFDTVAEFGVELGLDRGEQFKDDVEKAYPSTPAIPATKP